MIESNPFRGIKEKLKPILVSVFVLAASPAFGQKEAGFDEFKRMVPMELFKENTERQKQWMLNYLESVKFMERLKKELFATGKYKNEQELEEKAKKLKDNRTARIKRIRVDFEKLEEGLVGQTFIGVEVKPKITILLDTIQESSDPIPSTIVHENTHGSTLHEIDILKPTQKKIDEMIPEKNLLNSDSVLTVDDFDYFKDPSETHARMNEIRYLLNELKIYDPNTEDFTEEHYKKLMEIFSKYPPLQKIAVKIMLNVIKREDFIWMMNNIAGIDIRESTTNIV